MIVGFVNPDFEPIVPVAIFDINGYRWRREVIVDTGFDSDLTLDAEFIGQLGLTPTGQTEMTLADGQIVSCNYYEATVIWDGDYRGVYVMESENQFLLGTNLFRGSTLTVQMWAGGDVVID